MMMMVCWNLNVQPCCQRVNHRMIFRDVSQGKNASWVANTVHTQFWIWQTGLRQREVRQPASTHLWCCFHSWKSPLQLGIQKNWYCLHQCQLLAGALCKNCVSYSRQVESHSTACYSTPAAQYLPPLCNPRNQAIEIFHKVIFCGRSDVLMVTTIKTVVFRDMTSCAFVQRHQCCGGACCLHKPPCAWIDGHRHAKINCRVQLFNIRHHSTVSPTASNIQFILSSCIFNIHFTTIFLFRSR